MQFILLQLYFQGLQNSLLVSKLSNIFIDSLSPLKIYAQFLAMKSSFKKNELTCRTASPFPSRSLFSLLA
jgi:hypothetical protein